MLCAVHGSVQASPVTGSGELARSLSVCDGGFIPMRHVPFVRPGQWFVVVSFVGILLVSALLRFLWLDRYPLGWHHDEALMGVMAGEVYRGESRPIFFTQYLGQEPLYIYLSGGMIWLLGGDEGVLPLRLTSALVGLVTVAVTFLLGRAMFSPRVGLLAAALLGTSFWQVMSSRNAYRSITQPLLEGLAVYLLWRARTGRHLGWYGLSGVALGGVLYTYLGARAFPAVFVGFGLWLLITRGRPTRSASLRGAILALAALLVATPLLIFFLTHPGTFVARIAQVSVFESALGGSNPLVLLQENLAKALRTFTVEGDPLWRYNIPGRPVFVGALAIAFYGGFAVALRRLWRRDDAAALLLAWLATMLIPSLLSYDVGAYTLRAMGLVPALYVVPALGLDWLWRWLTERRPRWSHATTGLIAVVLLAEVAATARDYFVVWAPSFGASWEGGADAVAQAEFLVEDADPQQEEIFVGSEYYHHAVLAQLARPVYPYLRWFTGRQTIVFPTGADRPVLYALAFGGMPPSAGDFFPPETLVGERYFLEGVDGNAPPPLFLAYRLTPPQVRAQVQQLLDARQLSPVIGRIPGLIEPLGSRAEGPARPGEAVPVTFVWRIEQESPSSEYQIAVHLLDQQWRKLSGVDSSAYPSGEWRAGDIVWSDFLVPVPRDTEAGLYKLQVVFFDALTNERLPVAGGVPGIPALVLDNVRITATEAPSPSRALEAHFGPDIVLKGTDTSSLSADSLSVVLYWSAPRALTEDYTVFVQLLSPSGELAAQSDSQPANGALPTSSWLPGEVIRDEHRLRLPASSPPGTYRLIAGLYLLSTGERLPLASGGTFIELAKLTLPPG